MINFFIGNYIFKQKFKRVIKMYRCLFIILSLISIAVFDIAENAERVKVAITRINRFDRGYNTRLVRYEA